MTPEAERERLIVLPYHFAELWRADYEAAGYTVRAETEAEWRARMALDTHHHDAV